MTPLDEVFRGRPVLVADTAIKNLATDLARTAVTNSGGFYMAPNLQPGDYELSVSAAGFETTKARLQLTVGSEQVANFSMKIKE